MEAIVILFECRAGHLDMTQSKKDKIHAGFLPLGNIIISRMLCNVWPRHMPDIGTNFCKGVEQRGGIQISKESPQTRPAFLVGWVDQKGGTPLTRYVTITDVVGRPTLTMYL